MRTAHQCKLLIMSCLLAERVGFEPTCRLPDKTLSRRPRYDHFGTSPSATRDHARVDAVGVNLDYINRYRSSRWRSAAVFEERLQKRAALRFTDAADHLNAVVHI